MVQMEGKYYHVKSENLDEYFKAVGVPYIPRKMMCSSNPTIEITKLTNDDDKWQITTSTMFRTTTYTFKLGEEYEETMPGITMKCKTTMENDKLFTLCVAPDGTEITRTYSFSDDGMTILYRHKKSQKEAIRHFKRATA